MRVEGRELRRHLLGRDVGGGSGRDALAKSADREELLNRRIQVAARACYICVCVCVCERERERERERAREREREGARVGGRGKQRGEKWSISAYVAISAQVEFQFKSIFQYTSTFSVHAVTISVQLDTRQAVCGIVQIFGC